MRIIASSNRAAVRALLSASRTRDASVERRVGRIVADVRRNGDRALRRYAVALDDLEGALEIPPATWERAAASLSPSVRRAVRSAARNIRHVARAQRPREFRTTVRPGVVVQQRVIALDRVGCYVPGGRYPLPSSLLMTAIPASVAGVGEVVVTCPKPHPVVLAAAMEAGVDRVFASAAPMPSRRWLTALQRCRVSTRSLVRATSGYQRPKRWSARIARLISTPARRKSS